LVKAAGIEAKKVAELEKMAETKKKMEAAKAREDGYDWKLPPGMQLDQASQASSDDEEDPESVVPKSKQPKMKTQSQKNKAARVAAEVICSPSVSGVVLTFPSSNVSSRIKQSRRNSWLP
jgi:nucleolar protein 53